MRKVVSSFLINCWEFVQHYWSNKCWFLRRLESLVASNWNWLSRNNILKVWKMLISQKLLMIDYFLRTLKEDSEMFVEIHFDYFFGVWIDWLYMINNRLNNHLIAFFTWLFLLVFFKQFNSFVKKIFKSLIVYQI